MGGVEEESQRNGTKQIKVSREDSDRGNTDWKLAPVRDTTAGKILERLEILEKRHLEYVHSHQARLKARLGESEEAENEFKEESNQIKTDIFHLVAHENSGDDVIQVK
jgi:CRISPR/Cas system-associated protein Csm6